MQIATRRGRLMKTQGFTIVELLVVIVVIGILAAISIVAYNGIQDRARTAKMQTDFRAISQAMQLAQAENFKWPICSTGSDSFSECDIGTIVSQFSVQGLPTMTGAGDATPIRYVVQNNTSQWAVRFRKQDGTYCKMGYNMITSWWGGASNCW